MAAKSLVESNECDALAIDPGDGVLAQVLFFQRKSRAFFERDVSVHDGLGGGQRVIAHRFQTARMLWVGRAN